jgi:protein-tyrosine phosphatase
LVKTYGIKIVISLTEYSLEKYIKHFYELKKKLALSYYHIPTADGTGFFIHQFEEIISIYETARDKQFPVLIHCAGGIGRTSTALIAIWMYIQKVELDTALSQVKQLRPQAMITSIQKHSLELWEKHLYKHNRLPVSKDTSNN